MKTLATGSDSLAVEQDFKARFNTQKYNHRKSSLSGFELFINRWNSTDVNGAKNIDTTDAEP